MAPAAVSSRPIRITMLASRISSSVIPQLAVAHCTPFARCNFISPHQPSQRCLWATRSQPAYTQTRLFSSTNTSRSQPSSFTYRISAAYSSKRHPLKLSRNVYVHNPSHRVVKTASELSSMQRKLNRPASGQDSFFVSNVGESSDVAFGVVDGVGGWESSGVDPADFAHSLCEYMASAAGSFPESFSGKLLEMKPVELLELGFRRVEEDRSIQAGGSTACVAFANTDGRVEVANLGDSGFAHLSPLRLQYVSPPQTHAFNTPYQLSKYSPKMKAQMSLFGNQAIAEEPADAEVTSHQLEHGDILIFATDGVWDNLSPEEILQITSRIMVRLEGWVVDGDGGVSVSPNLPALAEKIDKVEDALTGKIGDNKDVVVGLPAVIAAAITREAKITSHDMKRDGPFAKEVQKLYPEENYRGGKVDDICTVVAIALRQ